MILSNLDTVTRRWLLERNLPIHYYADGLFHSATAVRELSYDTLQIINSANLLVNNYGAIDLPDDFVDDLSVCVPYSGILSPLPKQDLLTPIRIHDTTTGEFTPYPNQENTTGLPNVYYGFPNQWQYYFNVNEFGEQTGRRFGSHGGTAQGYKLFKERRQIQLTPSFIDTQVTLLYISDGQRADNASQVDVLAIQCIQAWMDWKTSPSRSIKNSQEAATFYNEKRRLRSLLNPMTKADVVNVLRNSYTAGLKF